MSYREKLIEDREFEGQKLIKDDRYLWEWSKKKKIPCKCKFGYYLGFVEQLGTYGPVWRLIYNIGL